MSLHRAEGATGGVLLLLLDVDGVLTDGKIMLAGDGTEIKAFDVQDGAGIGLARSVGIKVGIITGRTSQAVERRARELSLDVVRQGASDKLPALRDAARELQVDPQQIAYVGDDWADLPVMAAVGVPLAVANARPEVKAAACHVSTAPGGSGAVRELIEWLLEREGLKAAALAKATKGAFSPSRPWVQ